MKDDLFKTLKPATRRWANGIMKRFVLESHHRLLLLAASQAWDRAQEAKALVDAQGAVILDRFSSPKEHPGCAVEARATLTFMKALRELGLDLERPEDPRPPCRPGGY